jgi:hypothetical protein
MKVDIRDNESARLGLGYSPVIRRSADEMEIE